MNFATILVTMNGQTCKLFKNIINDVQTNDNEEINTAEHNYSKQVYFDTVKFEGPEKFRFVFA